MSNVYFARPVTLSGPSSRLTEVPRTVGLAGHAHFLASSLGPCCAGGTGGFCGLATRHPLCFQSRFHDAIECATAADVAVESSPYLFGSRVRIFLENADGSHDEAGCAETAHQTIGVAECLLHRMQVVALGQSVDGTNPFSLNLDGE